MNFNTGDRVKLKSYSGYGDYIAHRDQKAVIVERSKVAFDFKIRWSDGRESFVDEENLILCTPNEWDIEENESLMETK